MHYKMDSAEIRLTFSSLISVYGFFSLWSLCKYGVLLVPKSRGLYEVSKDGISSNYLHSSSSITFSTPAILFFQAEPQTSSSLQGKVHKTHAQHRWRRQTVCFCN
jgi:hypothetical protein